MATLTNSARHSATVANSAYHLGTLTNSVQHNISFLLTEDGGFLLQESGFKIQLDQVTYGVMTNSPQH